jgi:hypothetical protein
VLFFHDCSAFSFAFREIRAPATEPEDLGSAFFSVAACVDAFTAAVWLVLALVAWPAASTLAVC